MKSIIFTLLILFSAETFAYDPHDSFRGIKWGTDISQLSEEMTAAGGNGKTAYYNRKNDQLKIGEAQLSSVKYLFYEGKFYKVVISFNDLANCVSIKNTLLKIFGKAYQGNKYVERYTWRLVNSKSQQPLVDVLLDYSDVRKEGGIIFSYIPIENKIHLDIDGSNRRGVKDI